MCLFDFLEQNILRVFWKQLAQEPTSSVDGGFDIYVGHM